MKIKIKLLHENAKVPFKHHDTDACFDCVATEMEELHFGYVRSKPMVVKYKLGIAFDLPEGVWIDLRPRSSVYKTGLSLSNGCGTGDESYTGEYMAMFYNIHTELPNYKVGDSVCQIRFVGVKEPVTGFEIVDELRTTTRGAGGFGSTDK